MWEYLLYIYVNLSTNFMTKSPGANSVPVYIFRDIHTIILHIITVLIINMYISHQPFPQRINFFWKLFLRKREEKHEAIYVIRLQQNALKCYQLLNLRHLPTKLKKKWKKKKIPLKSCPYPKRKKRRKLFLNK